ncbi:MAG: tRNA (adenosine(37)-N6)-threonylcarbamoyltransferase complex dimerization subunit type 1 TsaB [Lysobacterales bacterium]
MNLLAIETSTETCSVALAAGGETRELYEHAPRKHAELLLPWVQQLMSDAGLGFGALDAIAFSCGPGSFTSLRIGIGVVQGLAWGADRPVVPVSSLASTAQAAAAEGICSTVVALDARMDEVFTGAFRLNEGGIAIPVDAERVCRPQDVREPAGPDVWGIGIGFARYEALAALGGKLAGVRSDLWPRAATVIELARHWLRDNDPLPAEHAQPVYLRDNVAKKQQG